MQWFRQWLLGMVAAAMLCAAAQCLMPRGTVRRVGRFTGGLVLLLCAVQPLWQLDAADLTAGLARYGDTLKAQSQAPAAESLSLMRDIIERECGAYIQEQARALGVTCTAAVVCQSGELCPVPAYVTVTGQWDEGQLSALRERIELDLAIPPERQYYQRESGDG